MVEDPPHYTRFLIAFNVANRLFGLLLTAIAFESMATGLRELFPVLAGR